MDHPEAVADVGVRPPGPFSGKFLALRRILARFTRIEPDVLKQSNLTGAQCSHCRIHGRAAHRVNERHGCGQKLAEASRDRLQG